VAHQTPIMGHLGSLERSSHRKLAHRLLRKISACPSVAAIPTLLLSYPLLTHANGAADSRPPDLAAELMQGVRPQSAPP